MSSGKTTRASIVFVAGISLAAAVAGAVPDADKGQPDKRQADKRQADKSQADKSQADKGPPATKAPANAVQKEMRLLEAAMQESVAAIAKGDVRGLPKRLHAVHMAGGDTSKALKDGSYKLPQRATDVDGFLALDKAFHTEMIKMVKAARKNDVATTSAQFGKLMARCHACHATYRFPPAR